MIRIGEVQDLKIVKKTDFGVYLGNEEERVLLPRKQVPENASIGDTVTVFIYRDSQDRLLATTNKPALVLGEVVDSRSRIQARLELFLTGDLKKIFSFLLKNRRTGFTRAITALWHCMWTRAADCVQP